MSTSKIINCFDLDDYRTKLVKDKRTEELIKTYNYSTVIDNPNTKTFWNKKIESGEVFGKLDSMSKDRIIQAVKLIHGENGRILDLGFGYGYFEQKLKERGDSFQLYGVDVSSRAVDRAKKKYGKNFFLGSIFKLPFQSNLFDFVVSLECLEHIQSNKIFKTLNEIKRVLKKSGKVVFSVPINEQYSLSYNPNNHLRRYSKELFIQELIIAGLKVEKTVQLYAFSSFYSLKKLLKVLLPDRWKPNILIVRCSIKK